MKVEKPKCSIVRDANGIGKSNAPGRNDDDARWMSRADRAKIARLFCRMLSWILLGRGRVGRRHAGDDGGACELFEMEVPERKGKLQRHRRKREPSAPPPIGTNLTHRQHAPTPASPSVSRNQSGAMPSV